MSLLTTTAGADGLFPQEWVNTVIWEPLQEKAACLNPAVATRLNVAGTEVHAPVVADVPDAGWVSEGAPIGVTDGTLRTATYHTAKLAGATTLTLEAARDSSPDALAILMQGLTDSLAKRLDQAYFGTKGTDPVRPAGLGDLADTDVTVVNYAPAFADALACFVKADTAAGRLGVPITAWVTGPATAEALGLLEESTDGSSRRGLLDPDPTVAGRNMILGRPLIVASNAAAELDDAGLIYAATPARSFVGMRSDVEVETTDQGPGWLSDVISVKARLRATPAFPSPKSVIRIKASA